MENKYIHILILAIALILTACNKDDPKSAGTIVPEISGTFTDERDGVEYKWVRYGNLEWMTENLRYAPEQESGEDDYDEEDSEYYNDEEQEASGYYQVYIPTDLTDKETEAIEKQNFAKYGYLYDVDAASSAVPPTGGWRLPTDEDWQRLEEQLGMDARALEQKGWRGEVEGEQLQQPGFLHLLPGGFYDYEATSYAVLYRPYDIAVRGMYWTASPDNTQNRDNYFFREIRFNSGQVYRNSTLKYKLMSVRCVRNVNP